MKTYTKKALVLVITTLAIENTEAQQFEASQPNWTYQTAYANNSSSSNSYNGTTINYNDYNNGWGNAYYDNDWSNNYYGNYYNDFLYMKNFTKRVLSNNAQTILYARNVACLDPINTGLVVKAIRHQRFAKSLYRRGFFNDALQHSDFATSLAADAINFYQPGFFAPLFDFNEGFGYQNDFYGIPYYKDGNNFKKGDNNSKNQKNRDEKNIGNRNTGRAPQRSKSGNMSNTNKDELEKQLPNEDIKEDQLFKIKENELKIDEL